MHSPEVLKAIYALEHGQSVDRMAQTLLQFGVTRAEIEVLLNDKGDEPASASTGIHWAPLAERIASERAARGWPVVSLEMLRRATTTSARVETVRIHAQNRRISLVGSSPSPSPATPPMPAMPMPAPAPTASVPSPLPSSPVPDPHFFTRPINVPVPRVPGMGSAAPPAAAAPGRPAIVAVSKASFSPVAAIPSSLLRELERAAQLLMMNSGIESTLPPSQIETLRTALRSFLEAAEEIAASSVPPPAATPVGEPRAAASLGGRLGW